ncbi:MAG TPA: hypothetical protein DEO70_12135 [Bacteroidales bacterium]|nr:MAG: hypothetical protein A2X11_10125 [Bacteroidetes bacterium GWE2_42_24]OFY25867.1 MAG: hypothetical protein A2X09_09500 [Bacteroidetes bacterium GWF2_43_11]HBZ67577.1 hypothetical protein [Bacteroidales bacterium]
MSPKTNEVTLPTTINIERLHALRNLIVNHRMLDSDTYDFKETPITETLKMLLHVFMESDWPTIVTKNDRSAIDDHFWMAYDTASYIEHLDDPSDEKDTMLMTIDQLIQLVTQLQEEAS